MSNHQTTNQKERRMHDFGLLEENVCFSSFLVAPPFPFSLSFYLI
jgi:hypothetical protein